MYAIAQKNPKIRFTLKTAEENGERRDRILGDLRHYYHRSKTMSLGTILLIILILILLGVLPTWPHSRSWGFAPSGVIGVVVIVLLLLALTGRL